MRKCRRIPKYNCSKTWVKLEDHIEVTLPEGTKTQIDLDYEELLTVFPSWQRRRNHVSVSRLIPTEYGYAREKYYLHRLLTRAPKNLQVDHKDRDSFNNRKSNLRFATASQNSANVARNKKSKSGYRGVFMDTRMTLAKRFRAYISGSNKKHIFLGYFERGEDAARAYDKAAREKWGEFAVLNFPEEHNV